ncbi:MAG: helix-turn-helix domain-containing protein [Actinomycetota bacterium]|nr:helix-turn-helix domain-containing protein [Actinomycetota bacterium]
MYYATIRRYKSNEDVIFDEIRPALDSLLPLIRERVIAYYVLDAGDGAFATISICEDKEKLETTNRVITEWLKQYLASSIVSQEEVPNLSLEVDDPLVGPLYEEVSEPVYKRSLQLLSVPEVGELLGMGRSWVYNQIKSGEIPSVQLGGSVKVKREDLEEYIDKHRRHQANGAENTQ